MTWIQDLHSKILILRTCLKLNGVAVWMNQYLYVFTGRNIMIVHFCTIFKKKWHNFLIIWRFLRSRNFFHSGLNHIYLLWPVPMCIIYNRDYDLSCKCGQRKINIFFLLSSPLFCTAQIQLCWFTFISLLWLITLMRIKVYTNWENTDKWN